MWANLKPIQGLHDHVLIHRAIDLNKMAGQET
ncbi:Uncharacterised protein [Vibrio cholerae]|nr:Uncharacterised protein [Vibrio cholerae]